MKIIIILIPFLLLLSSCCPKKDFLRIDFNYKLFSLSVNLDSDYILFSRRQRYKKLSLLPPPSLDKNFGLKQLDSLKNDYENQVIDWATPKTTVYKISEKEHFGITSILKSFKAEDLVGEVTQHKVIAQYSI